MVGWVEGRNPTYYLVVKWRDNIGRRKDIIARG
jgi:hypothetical protein